MAIRTEKLEYSVNDQRYEGILAWDDELTGPRPGVMVCHAWAGQGDFEVGKCRDLASMGFVALAADVYGQGRRGSTREENERLMMPLVEDRAELLSRLEGSLAALKSDARVDGERTAAIGFCFGGLCVLDLARSGADLDGVASFHGLLGRPEGLETARIRAKVLLLHGWDDPMATPDDVLSLTKEFSEAGADWQLHAYGGTVHAFTNPAADDPDFGTVYDERADRRSFAALQYFLNELFA